MNFSATQRVLGMGAMMSAFLTGMYYLRLYGNGEAFFGVLACIFYGCALYNFFEGLMYWKKGRKTSAYINTLTTLFYIYVWYYMLQSLNRIYVTGIGPFNNDKPIVGYFGIEGLPGFLVFVPCYFGFIILMWAVIEFIDWWIYRPKVSFHRKDEYYVGKVTIDTVFNKVRYGHGD